MDKANKTKRKEMIQDLADQKQAERTANCPGHKMVSRIVPRMLYIPQYKYEECSLCGYIPKPEGPRVHYA